MQVTVRKVSEPVAWADATRSYKIEQRQNIAEAALTLLTEHGGSALSMSAIAQMVGISRPTLYRYYPDMDSVLLGVAELVAQHDEAFAATVLGEPDPSSQLSTFLNAITDPTSHGPLTATALEAALPPAGRELLGSHEDRARELLADILRRGIKSGHFTSDLDPVPDARLILGLAQQSLPDTADRVHLLVDRIVQPSKKRKS